VPDPVAVAALKGTRALAFAGIADPEKFFATLAAAGIPAPLTRGFPDHHPYSAAEAARLVAAAERDRLQLVTTEKDLARIQGNPALAELAAKAKTLPVTLVFDDENPVRRLLEKTISRTLA
jgi:tetraacyldisaccharide 4'-kinase